MMKSRFPLLVSTVFITSLLASAQDYSITKLPTLGGKLTRAFAINESGQVAGESETSTYSHAFVWTRTAGIQDLQAAGDFPGAAYAINNNGQVAGALPLTSGATAFLWTPATGIQNLQSLETNSSTASGLNDAAEVVGAYSNGSQGFVWTAAEGMQDIGALGCLGCYPNAVNNSGEIIGRIYLPDGSNHAFLWTQAEGMRDLGTLGGPNSSPTAINSAGQIVGVADTASGVQHAFLWTQASGMQDLGTLPGEGYSWAFGIDATGRVVGSSWHPGKTTGLPFSWTQAGGMVELGPYRNLKIQGADGVNSAGLVIVSSYNSLGDSSYLVTPLMFTTLTSSPNPATLGETVTFAASVSSPVQGTPPDGEIVTFMSGSTILGTGTLKAGVATFTTSTLKKGSRSVKGIYAGDSNYASSKSALVTQVVVK